LESPVTIGIREKERKNQKFKIPTEMGGGGGKNGWDAFTNRARTRSRNGPKLVGAE